MEQNLPIITKKIWKIVRVIYFMLRKGISKGKLLSALNAMMKRGKIAGREAIQNLYHHHQDSAAVDAARHLPNEYEFSCGDSPAVFHLPFHLRRRKYSGHHKRAPLSEKELMAAAEVFYSTEASPALPGFGPSPMVRKLRVTDSPFPLRDTEEDNHVDEAAEEFIIKFYRNLRQQN